MKIEIGESLVLSWLKHVKMCQVVQTNWKPSPEWEHHHNELGEEVEKYASEYFLKLGYDLFKKNNSGQVQKQAEVDILGVAFENSEQKIYAVDIAFHKGGLGYGGTSENITRVLKKCIRTMVSLIKYFDVTTGHIIFASPKINRQDYEKLRVEFRKIDDIVKQFRLNFTFELISNEKFSSAIMQPVMALSAKVSDTSELFLRSVQLLDCGLQGEQIESREKRRKVVADRVYSPSDKCACNKKKEISEVNKVNRRLKLWSKNREQVNSQILRAYLKLQSKGKKYITEEDLKNSLSPSLQSSFSKNFPQMKNFGEKNHGKVFAEESGCIIVWQPVACYVDEFRKAVGIPQTDVPQ